MLTRIITAVACIPLVILIILLGNPVLQFTMMCISLIALYEFYNAIKSSHHPMKYLGYGAIIVYYLFFDITTKEFSIYLSLLLVLALSIMVIYYPKYTTTDVAMTVFGVVYTGLLFGFIVLIRDTLYGDFWIWLILISSWGSDTFAYFVGKTLGKHKLAPILSPNKTIEGSVGGVIGAGVLACVYTLAYTSFRYAQLKEYIVIVIIMVMIAAIISQFGDLAASAVKRSFKQKDFGYLLPGHGGILDRFDSILFVAPVIYVAVVLAQKAIG